MHITLKGSLLKGGGTVSDKKRVRELVRMPVKANKKAVKRGANAVTRSQQKGLLLNIRLMRDRTAVVVFLVMLVVIIFFFDGVSDQGALDSGAKGSIEDKLVSKNGANKLLSELKVGDSGRSNAVGFIDKDTVDPQLLDYFTSMEYDQIKAQLGVEGDFVIHFEDENGRVIPLGNKWCIGSDNVKVNGIPCS